jgi:hypothetical protein
MDEAMEMFVRAIGGESVGDIIVSQERAGGRTLATNEQVPKSLLHDYRREDLEAAGFVFGEDIDDLFVAAKLPDGWTKGVDPEDPYGRTLYFFDEQGRKRGSIFYKAAFYDRYASATLYSRFWIETHFSGDTKFLTITDRADGSHLRTTPSCNRGEWEYEDRLTSELRDYLVSTYPDYPKWFAYWSDKRAE